METVSLKLDEIFDLAKKTLLANGCDDETGTVLADLIMKAERDGSLSHGLFRLPAYVSGLKSGKINGKARPEVKKMSPSVIKVLGNNCLAPMVLNKGLPELIKTATPFSLVALINSGKPLFRTIGAKQLFPKTLITLGEIFLTSGLAFPLIFPLLSPAT